jgi:hypothetical protein
VIVVLVIVMMLVVGFVIAKTDLTCEACLSEQFESTVNSSESDCGIDLVYEAVKVLAGKVFLSAQKYLEDEVTLACTPQSCRLNMLKEDRTLYLEFVLFPRQKTPLSLKSILPFQL